jgi:hypothetical protein
MDLFKIILGMDMEILNGIMDNFFKEIGKWEQKTGMENGNLLMEVHIKESGILICSMEKESISIQQEYMRVILLILENKVSENRFILMEMFLMGNIRMGNQMEKENMNGKMDLIIKEVLSKD